ncbi:unnamed protein product, partial [Chrysoparadoxa australica]
MALFTDRTILSAVQSSDLASIHALLSFPETDEYNTLGIPKNEEETRAIMTPWVEEHTSNPRSAFTFAIKDKSDHSFLGLIAMVLGKVNYRRAEVWFKIHPNHWNKGVASETLSRTITFGFEELKLHRIEAGCAVGNIGSIKVLEKVGMTREGRGRQVLPLKTGWSDNYEYAVLESDD